MDGPEAATIVALSSGRPPAAIAVVRSSGPHAHAAAEKLSGQLPPPRQARLVRLIDPRVGSLIDEALLLRFDAPHSATGEDIVEFHCHGGRATVDALLDALLAMPGMRLAEAGEFTRRSLANGRIDLTEAEGLADLLSAETELQRRSAMTRAGGALRARLDEWRERLLQLSARAEVAIDYSDEDDGSSPDPALALGIAELAHSISSLSNAPRVEPLREGIRVVIAGPPNAGKSSLINALAQVDRVIVTPIAGTTRDVIEVPLAIGGIPFVLVDTAGIRESDDVVEAIGIDRARTEVRHADLLVWMGAGRTEENRGDVISLWPKCDLGAPPQGQGHLIPVSSRSGEGLELLVGTLIDKAKSLLPKGDEIAVDRRQHELISAAASALHRATGVTDPVLIAEELRSARLAVDRISGRAGVEDLLDALFGRFCLGK